MGNSKLLTEIKGIVGDLVDSNGNFRTIPIGTIGKRSLPEDRIMLLQRFVSLLRDTRIISEETKMYILDKYITIKGVNEALSERKGTEIKYNATMGKIGYDRLKLEREFGGSILSDIIFRTNNSADIETHSKNIAKAYMKYGESENNKLRNGIALDLDTESLCVELDDNKFTQFISTIAPYIKSHMKAISDGLDKDSVGYFNYILSSPVKASIDKQRLEYIKQLLDPSISHPVNHSGFEDIQYNIE